MTNDDLRTDLTKLADEWAASSCSGLVEEIRDLLDAHPAPETDDACCGHAKCPSGSLCCCPASASDTRREDVAREAEIEREALRQFPDAPYMDDRDQVRLGFEAGAEWAIARLAALPAPPVVDEAEIQDIVRDAYDTHIDLGSPARRGEFVFTAAEVIAARLRGATRG